MRVFCYSCNGERDGRESRASTDPVPDLVCIACGSDAVENLEDEENRRDPLAGDATVPPAARVAASRGGSRGGGATATVGGGRASAHVDGEAARRQRPSPLGRQTFGGQGWNVTGMIPLIDIVIPLRPGGGGGAAGGDGERPRRATTSDFVSNTVESLVQAAMAPRVTGNQASTSPFFGAQTLVDLIAQLSGGEGRARAADPEAARSLPTATIAAVDVDNHVDCSVCKSEFELNDVATLLPCRHYFHDGCIQPWLERANSCPLCRAELPRSRAASLPH